MSSNGERLLPTWIRLWLRDSGAVLLSQTAAVVMTSAFAILIARSLGPAEWGVFAALLSVSITFSAFVDLGLATWLLRELSALWASKPSDLQKAAQTAGAMISGSLLLNLVLGSALVLGAFTATRIVGWGSDRSLALVGLAGYTALLSMATVIESVFRSRRELGKIITATILEKALLLALGATTLALGGELGGLGLSYIVAGLFRFFFSASLLAHGKTIPFSLQPVRAVLTFVRRSFPFALNTAGFITIPSLDIFLVATLSATSAGFFATGARIVSPALFIAASASSALFPFLARRERGTEGLRAIAMLGLCGALLSGVGIVAAPTLVPALFGEGFSDAVLTVQVMLLVLPFTFLSSGLLSWLYSSALERQVLAVSAAGAISGTGAIILGHIFFGPAGAGAGFVFRQVFIAVVLAGLVLAALRSTAGASHRSAPAAEEVPTPVSQSQVPATARHEQQVKP